MSEKEPERIAESEGPPRRQFFRRTVEMAVWSLFGSISLHAVIRTVVERVTEIQGLDRLAGQVAQDLRTHGAAYAEDYCSSPG